MKELNLHDANKLDIEYRGKFYWLYKNLLYISSVDLGTVN